MKTTVEVMNNNAAMNNERVINARLYIIPNPSYTPNELGWCNPENWENWKRGINKNLERFGLECTDRMIQIRVGNSNISNFIDAWHDYYNMMKGTEISLGKMCQDKELHKEAIEFRFPSHLPKELLDKVEDGDVLKLHHEDGTTFNLLINQSDTYQCHGFGNFKETLALVSTNE